MVTDYAKLGKIRFISTKGSNDINKVNNNKNNINNNSSLLKDHW